MRGGELWVLRAWLVFFLSEILADARLGAVVMGIGVLLGVLTIVARLGASGSKRQEAAA